MKRLLDNELMNQYFIRYDIENLLDKDILNYMQLHFYKKDEVILRPETKLEYYYLIVDGQVKISYLFENGKSMHLKHYQAFNTIGDLEFLKNMPVRCNVEAVEDTHLIALPVLILRKKYMSNINFLHHLIDSLSEKLYATINNSSYNYVYPLINRLSSYLVQLKTDKDYISLHSSFEEIAQFLGTTYRHLNRTFNELEAEMIIKCENKKISILDEEKLQELSKNSYIRIL